MRTFFSVIFCLVFCSCEAGMLPENAASSVADGGSNAEVGVAVSSSNTTTVKPVAVDEADATAVGIDAASSMDGGSNAQVDAASATDVGSTDSSSTSVDAGSNGSTDAVVSTAEAGADAGNTTVVEPVDAGSASLDVSFGSDSVAIDAGSTADVVSTDTADAASAADVGSTDSSSTSVDASSEGGGDTDASASAAETSADAGNTTVVEPVDAGSGQADSSADSGSVAIDAGNAADIASTDTVDAASAADVGGSDTNPCAGKNCDDGNECTTDTCSNAGVCAHAASSAACTGNGVCVSGACFVGVAQCDDNNPCTYDDIGAKTGCFHVNLDAACDDSNVCTIGDKCVAGTCTPGAPKNCSDNKVCTADICDALTGCSNPTVTAQPIDSFGGLESAEMIVDLPGWTLVGNWNVGCNTFAYGKGAIFSGCHLWFGAANPKDVEVSAKHSLQIAAGKPRTLIFDAQRIGNDPELTLKSGVRFLSATGAVVGSVELTGNFGGNNNPYDIWYHAQLEVPLTATDYQIWLVSSLDWSGYKGQEWWSYSERFDNFKVVALSSVDTAKCVK